MDKPYLDEKLNNWTFLRTFKHDVLSEELVWHRDEKGRYIEVLEGSGWEIQFDNGLPKRLHKLREHTLKDRKPLEVCCKIKLSF